MTDRVTRRARPAIDVDEVGPLTPSRRRPSALARRHATSALRRRALLVGADAVPLGARA